MIKATKKDKLFTKYKIKFENNQLSKDELCRLSHEKKAEYLTKNIALKFKIPPIKISCEPCAFSVLYNDSGYITDEDLLSNPEISKKFKHK